MVPYNQMLGQTYCKPGSETEVHFVTVERTLGCPHQPYGHGGMPE